jgi:flagellar protein FlaJ
MKLSGTPSLSPDIVCILIFFVTPMISIFFMIIAHMERKSYLIGANQPYKAAILPTIIVVALTAAIILLPPLQFLTAPQTFPTVITACLIAISIPPSIVYIRISKTNNDAENAIPSFLRDVTEARKIGLSPEKSIVHAAKRTGYGSFCQTLKLVRSQMEWGVSLRKIFLNVRQKVQTWPVLVNFFILVETIKIGGGSATALETLTEYSEKQKDVDSNKKSLLRPYVILAFIWSVLIAMTTTMVATTVFAVTQMSLPGTTAVPFQIMESQINLFSTGIIFQCWLSGFFVGKVNEGTFAAGFKYSAMLVLTAYVSLVISGQLIGGLYGAVATPS